jgi:glucosamine-6-phosphate deaminase
MNTTSPLVSYTVGKAHVAIYSTDAKMGAAAALAAANLIGETIAARGLARIMVGTGNSQRSLIDGLMRENVDWQRVVVFHMDEYVGIDAEHSASFRRWLRTWVHERYWPASVHYIKGDAPETLNEIARYSALLADGPIDVAFVGFGENGHIAFNDPGVADFNDPSRMKVVKLDDRCRKQQVGEGHFRDLAAVPEHALTVTCSELLAARAWICCVPEGRKAEAVRKALEGPVTPECPASVVRTHPRAQVFLETSSAALLSASKASVSDARSDSASHLS